MAVQKYTEINPNSIPAGLLSTTRARPKGHVAQLPALTGLRFFAAILIVLLHFAQPLVPESWTLIVHIIDNGYVGVNFFFVLSGFILAYTYITPEGILRGSRHQFYVARVARIVPVYLFSLLIGVGPYIFTPVSPIQTPTLITVITTLTFTQAWVPFSTMWVPPAWSLSVEAVFYAVFPKVFSAFIWFRCRYLLASISILWLLTIACPLIYVVLHPDGLNPQWLTAYWLRVVCFSPLPHFCEFLLGVAVARLFVLQRGRGQRLAAGDQGALLALGLIIALFVFTPFYPFVLMHNGLFDLPFALLIYAVAWNDGWIAKALSVPVLVLLGEASYSLYLLHDSIWKWILHIANIPFTGIPTSSSAALPFFCLFVSLVIALSILSYWLVEQPARHAIRYLVSRR